MDTPLSERFTQLLHRLQPEPEAEGLEFDVVIIGAGPAGLAAAFYAERERLSAVLLEQALVGGQLAELESMDHLPGYPKGIPGQEVGRQIEVQLEEMGFAVTYEMAEHILHDGQTFTVATEESIYQTRSVLLATGSRPKVLKIPGEERLRGHGISYNAYCDGPTYQGKRVAIIGGDNRSLHHALFLSSFAEVLLIYEEDEPEAEEILIEEAEEHPQITLVGPCDIDEICGESHVEGIRVTRLETSQTEMLPAEAIFITAKREACIELGEGLVQCSQNGYILTDENLMTQTSGFFACGDVRNKANRGVLSDLSDGAHAARAICHFLRNSE